MLLVNKAVPRSSPKGRSSLVVRADGAAKYRVVTRKDIRDAMTMVDLLGGEKPEAIAVEEHVARRRKKDIQELVDASKRMPGDVSEAAVRDGVERLEQILPGVLNLYRMKARDWVTVVADVDAVAERLVTLKALYQNADIFAMVAARPKLLLQSVDQIQEDGRKVTSMLAAAEDVSAIIQAVPELADPAALASCLSRLAALFPSEDPVAALCRNPRIMRSLGGEADAEADPTYGELTTTNM